MTIPFSDLKPPEGMCGLSGKGFVLGPTHFGLSVTQESTRDFWESFDEFCQVRSRRQVTNLLRVKRSSRITCTFDRISGFWRGSTGSWTAAGPVDRGSPDWFWQRHRLTRSAVVVGVVISSGRCWFVIVGWFVGETGRQRLKYGSRDS